MNANNVDLLAGVARRVRVTHRPHASRGGRAYDKEIREMVIQMMLNGGIEAVKSPEVCHLRALKKFPSLPTCKRWMRQYLTVGHIRPFKNAGGRIAGREIQGVVMFQLAFYRMVRPHARLYKVQAYLADRFPAIRPPFSQLQIHRAEKRLGLTRKAAFKTSQEA